MDVRQWNRQAWDGKVEDRVPWAIPVDPDTVTRARQGDWSIILTPRKPVPADWLGKVAGKRVLCLAGAGG
nr:SAM-dependent methyltransferase [Candidatus Krumholzibacteria bacterium]